MASRRRLGAGSGKSGALKVKSKIKSTKSSSSVVGSRARSSLTVDDDDDDDDENLISKIVKAGRGKIPPLVARTGIRAVRAWISEDCDLERDILPQLANIAANLRKPPMRQLQSDKFVAQIFAARDLRLAAQKVPGGGVCQPRPLPKMIFVAEGTPEWSARVAAGHKPRLMTKNEDRWGWFFPLP